MQFKHKNDKNKSNNLTLPRYTIITFFLNFHPKLFCIVKLMLFLPYYSTYQHFPVGTVSIGEV